MRPIPTQRTVFNHSVAHLLVGPRLRLVALFLRVLRVEQSAPPGSLHRTRLVPMLEV
jgi:hypothetical protein